MIQYVAKGEKLKASTINSLIDAVGGPGIGSDDLQFRRTPNGTIFSNRKMNFNMDRYDVVGSLFDVRRKFGLSGNSTIELQCGRDFDTFKQILPEKADHYYFVDVNDSSTVHELSAGSWYANGSGMWYDGYVNTMISSLEDSETHRLNLLFARGKEKGVEREKQKKAYVFTQALSVEELNASELEELSTETCKIIATETPKELKDPLSKREIGGQLIKIWPMTDISTSYDFGITTDSEVSGLFLSSLDPYLAQYKGLSVDPETGEEVPVTLSVTAYELFNFHSLSSIDEFNRLDFKDELSSYEVVCRKRSKSKSEGDDGVSAYIDYVPVSALMTSCDSDISSLELSSVQTKFDDKTMSEYHQLFNFQEEDPSGKIQAMAASDGSKMSLVDGETGEPLEDDTFEFVIRRHDPEKGMYVEYRNLDLSVTLSGVQDDANTPDYTLSSVQTISSDQGLVRQIFEFNQDNSQDVIIHTIGSTTPKLSGKVGIPVDEDGTILSADFIVRNNATKQVNYFNLSVDETKLDSYFAQTSSLNLTEDNEIQLLEFDKLSCNARGRIKILGNDEENGIILDENGDAFDGEILVRDDVTKELKYMELSVDPVLVDSEQTGLSSVAIDETEEGDKILSFHNFRKRPKDTLSAVLSNGMNEITPEQTWILCKTYTDGGGMELQYKHLALSCELSSISCDSEDENQQVSSMQFTNTDRNKLELFKFGEPDYKLTADEWKKQKETGKIDVLLRDGNSGEVLKYVDVNTMLSGLSSDIAVDDELDNATTISIEKVKDPLDPDAPYLRLSEFNGKGLLRIEDIAVGPDDYDLLVRQYQEDPEIGDSWQLKYVNISSFLSGLSGDLGNLSGDSQIPDCNTSSIVTLSTESGIAIRVKGFDGQETVDGAIVSANAPSYDVLTRHKVEDGKYDMQYVNVSAFLSGQSSGSGLREPGYNWQWPTETISGVTSYVAPGVGKMYGYYRYGYTFQYFSGTIPVQPEGQNCLLLSGHFSSSSTGYPKDVALTWNSSYNPFSGNISSWAMPLYARYNSPDNGPTYDYRAGCFVIPAYY